MTLRLHEMSVRLGGRPVLEGVSAAAAHGRITAVIGPNAAGKSTLLRVAAGLLESESGAVTLDDDRLDRLPARSLAHRLAYAPQRPQVGAAFTVHEVVELGRYAVPAAPERIERALEAMELQELRHRLFGALSVGQQQRVVLARALAQLEPARALILDEPTSAMDLRAARHAFDRLRDAADAGAIVLLAMHDLTAAARIADDVWVLRPGAPGKLVAAGPTVDVVDPARLAEVFGVPFRWLDAEGSRVLVDG